MDQCFCYLIDHEFSRLLGKLHEAVLNDVVNEEVNVACDALFVCKLLHGLLHQVGLRANKVTYVVYYFRIQFLHYLLRHVVILLRTLLN